MAYTINDWHLPMKKMFYDKYVSDLTKQVNQKTGSKFTKRQVHIAVNYPLSESGLISRFMDFYGDDMKFNPTTREWRVWGKYEERLSQWHVFSEERLRHLIKAMLDESIITIDIVNAMVKEGLVNVDPVKYEKNALQFIKWHSNRYVVQIVIEKLRDKLAR